MRTKRLSYLDRYETGKQSIALIINIFVLTGTLLQIFKYHKIYVPLELDIRIIIAGIYLFTIILLLIEKKRFYSYCYLIISYLLFFNIIISDVLFPETCEKLHLLRSEYFTRNLLILLPQVALLGFISGKKHMVIQCLILILYTFFEMIVNYDDFLKANILLYFLVLSGFSLASYFLVHSNQKFINELSSTNKKLKETQQQLFQSKKMASLGTLTAGISHEINNPLNFINGGVYLISNVEGEIQHLLSSELQGRFNLAKNMVQTGFDRINNIVQALMNFSNHGSSNLIHIQLNDIIDKTLLFLNTKINQEIEIRKHYELNVLVPVNPGKFHEVVYNILDNAIFALRQKGEKTKWIEISTKEENNKALIVITNNGSKIPKKLINQIFDPFFTTKDPNEGSGLGLSISYAIISEYKGIIYARNTVEGVSFIIEIPIDTKPSSNENPAKNQGSERFCVNA